MKRNQASQHIGFQMNKLADGTNADGLAGSIIVMIEKDGGGEQPAAGGVTARSSGGYLYVYTQAETDCYQQTISFFHSTAITQRLNIYTDDGLQVEIAKIIKSGETARHVQGTVHTNKDVEATATRV